jgi:SpoIID/LytB domain protein
MARMCVLLLLVVTPFTIRATPPETLWYQGKTEAAVAAYEEILRHAPEDRDARMSLVVLYRELGRHSDALELSRALAQTEDPDGRYGAEYAMTRALAETNVSEIGDVPGDNRAQGGPSDQQRNRARRWFWHGVTAMNAGESAVAARWFTAAVNAAPDGHLPYGHYFLGMMDNALGRPAQAAEALRTALDQDPNLTSAFLPLARAQWAVGDYRAARDRLQRAAVALPWNQDIPRLLAQWETERPELTAGAQARRAERIAAAAPPEVVAPPTDASDAHVRIGLAEELRSVYLKTGGPAYITSGGNRPPREVSGPAVLEIRHQGAGVAVSHDGSTLVESSLPVSITYEDPRYTTTIFDLTFGAGQFRAGREDRSYRGSIVLLPRGAGITVVNRLSVEEYLYSVVPSEMPAWWPPQALEAQAIAARSYTLHPRRRFEDRGFDLLSSVGSAYYPGVTNEHPRTTAAVNATRGLVLGDNGRPLDAVYSANNAGYSEAAGSVWGWPNSLVVTSDPLLAPLKDQRSPAEVYHWIVSRPDSFSGRAPFAARSAYRWDLLVAREDVERRLAAAGQSVGTVLRLLPGPRGQTGRVESVTVHGTDGSTQVQRDAIRGRLGGLRSNLFVVSPFPGDTSGEAPNYFYFQGAGWGHGVGMCQTGAAGMARADYSAREILAQYYPRNPIIRWY